MKTKVLLLFFLLATISLFGLPKNALAYANTSPIDTGYNSVIIDDWSFTNTNTMTAESIQKFLELKVPVCDTWHPNTIPGSGETPPWTCLKDYRDSVAPYRDPVDSSKAPLASYIIWKEAKDNGINPQVLLVTLQKENSLITDTWPLQSQYDTAIGYGCFENTPGECSYAKGFYNQIHLGTMLLREAFDRSCGNYNSYPGWGDISYNLHLGRTATIDGKATYIGSCATASLYNYTPHRPDSAWNLVWDSVNQRWGYFYGNYNFVNYFNNWFEPVKYISENTLRVTSYSDTVIGSPSIGQSQTLTIKVKNFNQSSVTVDMGVADEAVEAKQWDSFQSQNNITFSPGEEKTFTFTKNIKYAGTHKTWTSFKYNGIWFDCLTQDGYVIKRSTWVHLPDVRAMVYSFSSMPPIVGQPFETTLTIKSFEKYPILIDELGVANYNETASIWRSLDSNVKNITIAAGESITYKFSKTLDVAGTYNSWPTYKVGNDWLSVKNMDFNIVGYRYSTKQ